MPATAVVARYRSAGPKVPRAFTERDRSRVAELGMIRLSLFTEEAAR